MIWRLLAVLLLITAAAFYVAAVKVWTGPETLNAMFGLSALAGCAAVSSLAAWDRRP